MTDLSGKVVVVVGASSGIGEAIARALGGKENVKLVLAARRVDRLDAILASIKESNPKLAKALTCKLDVTARQDVQKFFEQIEADVGPPDIVVNCAGVMFFTLMKNQHWEQWEQTIDVCCKGTVNSCGAVLPSMLKRKTGHIVNISSDAARQTFPALTVYNAAKAFVHEFSKGLRCECVGTGIRVTELLPGDVRTDLIMQNSDKEAAEKMGVAIGEKVGGDAAVVDPKLAGYDAAARCSVLDAADVANAVLYAVTAPMHVAINEILIEPRDQMYGDPTAMAVSAA